MKRVTIPIGLGDSPPTATLHYGQDVRTTLRELPEASVHMVCTSPPYWGLRDYGRDGQIGLEQTPEEFVASLVEVFREVKRVLRPDGTLWVNLGDSYLGGGRAGSNPEYQARHTMFGKTVDGSGTGQFGKPMGIPDGMKPKDLAGIPWMVAFALRADGWYLRSDIIWHKESCMPESVRDRPTKAHEYVFLFSHPKSKGQYFYDIDAVREPLAEANAQRTTESYNTKERYGAGNGGNTGLDGLAARMRNGAVTMKNKRSVWTVNPKPYSGAHFAVWPPALVQPMIRAGTSEYGVCKDCGAPWARARGRACTNCEGTVPANAKACPDCGYVNDWKTGRVDLDSDAGRATLATDGASGRAVPRKTGSMGMPTVLAQDTWEPTCDCPARAVTRATVLDPFSGSATTGMVATQEGRNYVGIDLNEDYLELAKARVQDLPAPSKEAEHVDELDFFGE
jgi:DNA modification methylase